MDVQKMQKELEHLLAEVHWIQQKLKNLPEETYLVNATNNTFDGT